MLANEYAKIVIKIQKCQKTHSIISIEKRYQ